MHNHLEGCALLLESELRLISWTAFSSTALLASARIQNSFVLEHEDLFWCQFLTQRSMDDQKIEQSNEHCFSLYHVLEKSIEISFSCKKLLSDLSLPKICNQLDQVMDGLVSNTLDVYKDKLLKKSDLQIENRSSSCQYWSLYGLQTKHFICNKFGCKLWLWSIQNHARHSFQAFACSHLK